MNKIVMLNLFCLHNDKKRGNSLDHSLFMHIKNVSYLMLTSSTSKISVA